MISKKKLQFIKAIEITNVTHVKSNFLTQGTCRHITPNWVKDFPHESHLWFFTTYVLFQFLCARYKDISHELHLCSFRPL